MQFAEFCCILLYKIFIYPFSEINDNQEEKIFISNIFQIWQKLAFPCSVSFRAFCGKKDKQLSREKHGKTRKILSDFFQKCIFEACDSG